MKTLDEVIDSITKQSALEIRDQRCPEKDRFWADRDTYTDALYYLKEYRSEKQIWESDRKHYEDWIEQYKEARDKHQQAVKEMLKNPPLTWDELKQMEGNPVFVEECCRNGDLKSAGWWLIDYWNDDQICLRDQGGNPWTVHRTSLDRDWNAYRKERTDAEEG